MLLCRGLQHRHVGQAVVQAGREVIAQHQRLLEQRDPGLREHARSEEHTSELQSLMRISYAVFCLKKKKDHHRIKHNTTIKPPNIMLIHTLNPTLVHYTN